MLEIKNLFKTYKSKKGSSCAALKGISIKFPDKGLVFVLGKSGSGKSTFLNVISGLDAPDSGEIIIKGKSNKGFSAKDYDSYRNTYLGFIFQEYNVLDDFSVYDNVALALRLQSKKAEKEKVTEILKNVGLDGLEKRKPNELSGGQKQRVAIARALVKDPDIIFGDEPTGNLDSKTSEQIFDILQNLSKNKLVIIVSHDRDSAEKYADRIIELHDGIVVNDVSRTNNYANDFSINNNEIVIPYNKPLTQEQVDLINNTIKTQKDVSLKQAKSEYKKTTKVINKDKTPFKLIKSRLPNKFATQIGVSNFAKKKFRLVVTIFLTVVALTLFGLSQTFAGYDIVSASANSFIKNNINTLILKQGEYDADYDSFNYTVENTMDKNTYDSVFSDIYDTDNYYGVDLIFGTGNSTSIFSMLKAMMGKSIDAVYITNMSGMVVTNENNLKRYLKCDTLDIVAGDIASATRGVIVTDYFVECYVRSQKNPTLTVESIYQQINSNGQYSITDSFGTTINVVAVIGTNYLIEYEDIIQTYNVDSTEFTEHEDYSKFANDVVNFLSIIYTYSESVVNTVTNSSLGTYITRYKLKDSAVQDFSKDMYSSSYMFKSDYIKLLTNKGIDVKFSNDDYKTLVNADKNNIVISVDDYNKIFNTNISSTNQFAGFENKMIDLGEFKMFSKDNIAYEVDRFQVVAVYEIPEIYSSSIGAIMSDEKINEINAKNFSRKGVYLQMPTSEREIEALLQKANDNYIYHVSEISDTLYMVSQIFLIFSIIFQWVALILGIFSTILLFNFVSLSVINKKKDIGILRAIGARGTDVSKIFLIEAMIVGMITVVLSWGLMFLGVLGVNSLLSSNFKTYLQSNAIDKISLLSVGFGPVVGILLACLIVTVIATIIPIIKISKMKPVDAIKNAN